jgi:hypothetical protein
MLMLHCGMQALCEYCIHLENAKFQFYQKEIFNPIAANQSLEDRNRANS